MNAKSSKSDRGNLDDREVYQARRHQRLTIARQRRDRRLEADPVVRAIVARAVRVDPSLLDFQEV